MVVTENCCHIGRYGNYIKISLCMAAPFIWLPNIKYKFSFVCEIWLYRKGTLGINNRFFSL